MSEYAGIQPGTVKITTYGTVLSTRIRRSIKLSNPRSGTPELELGDWKENRKFRILAVDNGILSFR
jgi:hypothetical protein